MRFKILFILFLVLGMSACRSGGYVVVDDYDHAPPPALISFNIFDSYFVNSEFEFGPYAVSPYLDDGIFELFWDVRSTQPYRAELFLNDRSDPQFGILMSSAWCGPGEFCGNSSYQFCRYRDDLTMYCELPESLDIFADRDISSLFTGIPEDLYFVLEVCDADLFYCEYQSLPVTFE